MTRAYTTINTGGWRVTPVAIKKVEFPGGHVDTSLGERKRVKIFTDGQTHEATLAMEANVQRGTGTNAQLGCPAAGKTGTTSSFTDAWFDGFTTSLNTAVWVGYPNSTQSMTAVPGYGEMFGGLAPALIWHDFMSTAMQSRQCDPFPEPTTPFVSAPFFGEYASTGAPGGGNDPLAQQNDTTGNAQGQEEERQEEGHEGLPVHAVRVAAPAGPQARWRRRPAAAGSGLADRRRRRRLSGAAGPPLLPSSPYGQGRKGRIRGRGRRGPAERDVPRPAR